MKTLKIGLVICSALSLAGCGDKNATDATTAMTGVSASGTGTTSETGGGESDSSTGATTAATSTGAFVENDIPSGPPMCDPKPMNDCEDGQKCTWESAIEGDRNICVDVMGTGQAGDECMSLGQSDTCDVHKLCWGVDPETGLGACIEFCDTTDQCPNQGLCTITNDGTLPLCLPSCDPLAPDCPVGWACFDDPSGNWFCDRDVTADTGAHGDPCDCINCCSEGTVCVAPEFVNDPDCAAAGGCCANICDITDGTVTCPNAGESCISYYGADTPPPAFVNVGICGIPAP